MARLAGKIKLVKSAEMEEMTGNSGAGLGVIGVELAEVPAPREPMDLVSVVLHINRLVKPCNYFMDLIQTHRIRPGLPRNLSQAHLYFSMLGFVGLLVRLVGKLTQQGLRCAYKLSHKMESMSHL